ncbi:MAG: membrane fusion protein (multidrug efflux system) [Myxococcota bacterium]|jgi:membrane fusion protein (multidrug efflux system)
MANLSLNAPAKAMSTAMAALVLCTVMGCSEKEEEVKAAAVLRPPVMVAPAIYQDVVDRIEATGQLTAKADATIAAQVDGQVTELQTREGDAVAMGDVLLVIDPERRELELQNAAAHVAEAKAELAVARRNYKRTKSLSKGNAASEARLDEDKTRESLARSAVLGATARLGLAQRAVKDSTVRAPFDGLIARRHVSVGEYLTTGTALFDLVALDPIEVEFTLAEVDSSKVAIGHSVVVSIAPFPDEVFLAKVSMISPTIDPRTRTLRVKAELPNPEGRIRPGLFAHADLGVSERTGIVSVPQDAIVQRADGTVVFRLGSDDRVSRIQVETGVTSDGFVEIRTGIDHGDFVVVRGQTRLDDGISVMVRNADGSPAAVAVGASTLDTGSLQ